MKKREKIVQQAFLDDEERVIKETAVCIWTSVERPDTEIQ